MTETLPAALQVHITPAWLLALDYAGIAVFAITGALAAARKRQDLMTFAFFAAVTGVGGGTVRDLLVGAPVFWVRNPTYILVAAAAALVVFLLGERPWFAGGKRWRFRTLVWLDAVGLCVYAIVGAAKALAFGAPPVAAAVMGAITATVGGMIRDVLAGEPSILLSREIYITAALLGAGLFVALDSLGMATAWASVFGFCAGFGLRAAALIFGLSMPRYGGGVRKRED
jgi:uncharacterized membrane protein YeiH